MEFRVKRKRFGSSAKDAYPDIPVETPIDAPSAESLAAKLRQVRDGVFDRVRVGVDYL